MQNWLALHFTALLRLDLPLNSKVTKPCIEVAGRPRLTLDLFLAGHAENRRYGTTVVNVLLNLTSRA